MNQKSNASSKGSKSRLLLFVFAMVGLVAVLRYFNVHEALGKMLDWISGQGLVGAVVYFFIYVLACVLFVPGSILTIGAGVIYGVFWGSILVSVSATLGGTAAFLVGRYFARDWVASKIEGNSKFKAIDEAVGKEGWKIVGLTRLSPIFPFNLQNYMYGLTRVRLKHYFLASWIGMIPGTIMFVYIASLAGDLATLGSEGRARTTGEWVLYVVGLLATIAVTVYVTKIAKTALAQATETDN